MSNHVAVDFESFYSTKRKISLKTLGTDEYIWHPEVEIYLVSIHSEEGSFCGHPYDFDWEQIDGLEWVSHNAAFDRRVWHKLIHDRPDLGRVRPKHWHCTANLAAWLGVKRDLKTACHELLGLDVNKDARKAMDGWHGHELKQMDCWQEVVEYAERDAFSCWKLWEEFGPVWPQQEKDISEATIMQCLRGLPADAEYIDSSIRLLNRQCFEAKRNLPWANGTSEEAAVLSPIAVAEECRKLGIESPASLAEDSPSCQLWEMNNPEVTWIRDMRRYRKANLLLTKFQRMKSRIRPFDGRIGFSQKYCGTHTKRASGDSGFNVHGFQREAFACVPLLEGQSVKSLKENEKVDMRRAIAVPDGKEIVVADLSQIEPRFLAWLTQDVQKLELIRQGISVYQIHAAHTMGWDANTDLKKANPMMYQLAKMRVLGLSYGCGGEKFRGYCWNTYGYAMSPSESKRQVSDFRRKERLVKNFWTKLQNALDESIGDDFEIELPSWNSQMYRDVKHITTRGRREITGVLAGGRVNRLWGSSLCENVVQAGSRDCFYEKIVQLEKDGIPTILGVHDEVVTDGIDSREVNEVYRHVQEVMSADCAWLPGLLLGSESIHSPFYLK